MKEWLFQQGEIKTTEKFQTLSKQKVSFSFDKVMKLLAIPHHVFPVNIWHIFAISGNFSSLNQNQKVFFLQQHAKHQPSSSAPAWQGFKDKGTPVKSFDASIESKTKTN